MANFFDLNLFILNFYLIINFLQLNAQEDISVNCTKRKIASEKLIQLIMQNYSRYTSN